MGNHRPSRSSIAERFKTKRMMIATAAAGAVLIGAGTAGAAIIDDPAPAGTAADDSAVTPSASAPSAAQPSASAPDQQAREEAAKKAEQAQENATQTVTSKAAAATRTPEPEQDSGSEEGGSGSDLSPSGEGGQCEASMYSDPQPTASGETFDPSEMTAAHKSLPFQSMVQVTNPDNGKSVTVRITDRGPYVSGRCLDLSTASFTQIASQSAGIIDVQWQVVS